MMRTTLDKKGIGMIELIGSVFVMGMVMSLLSSLVYYVYRANKKVGIEATNTSSSIFIIRNFRSTIAIFEPQASSIQEDGSLLLEKSKIINMENGTASNISSTSESKVIISLKGNNLVADFYSAESFTSKVPIRSVTYKVSPNAHVSTLDFLIYESESSTTTNISISGKILNETNNSEYDFSFIIPYYRFSNSL